MVPIGYDAGVNRWVLDKPIISVDYKMYEGFFPLRTQPKETGRTRTLDDFMESTQPWFRHESRTVTFSVTRFLLFGHASVSQFSSFSVTQLFAKTFLPFRSRSFLQKIFLLFGHAR